MSAYEGSPAARALSAPGLLTCSERRPEKWATLSAPRVLRATSIEKEQP